MPLGVMPFPSYRGDVDGPRPGGTVLLYTDGLVERPGAHIDDGMARLADVVRDGARGPGGPVRPPARPRSCPAGGAPDDVALLALRNMPMARRFRVEFPAAPEALASMRALLRRWLRHAEGSDQEIAEITTACGEAATNAIEHAGSAGGAPFEVSGRSDGREVEITVRDFGAWRDPREGDQGRGLSLMRALMDTVDVEPGRRARPSGCGAAAERGHGGPVRTTWRPRHRRAARTWWWPA